MIGILGSIASFMLAVSAIAYAECERRRMRRAIIRDIKSRPLTFSCYKCNEPTTVARYYIGTEIVCGDCYEKL